MNNYKKRTFFTMLGVMLTSAFSGGFIPPSLLREGSTKRMKVRTPVTQADFDAIYAAEAKRLRKAETRARNQQSCFSGNRCLTV